MNGYQHVGLDERRDIYRLVATGRSVREVAATLRRHPSTIYRELKRNRNLDEHHSSPRTKPPWRDRPLFSPHRPACSSWTESFPPLFA
ncbi:helix-turn-helix domain-containing protein [Sphingobium tyrosinilyticum]|uniref:Helix-turn-helix domain-containing protein n=1 Tax=Sphingobium tyrosinilyticum TaxID=2715436 RepID=A0ABV9F4E7_9SPHN